MRLSLIYFSVRKKCPYDFGQETQLLEGGRLCINGTDYIGKKGFGRDL